MSNTNMKTGKISMKQLIVKTKGYQKPAVKIAKTATGSTNANWADVDDAVTENAIELLDRYHKEHRKNIRMNVLLELTRLRKENSGKINDPRFFVMERPIQTTSTINVNDLLDLLQPFGAKVDEYFTSFKFPYSYGPTVYAPLDFAYWQMVLTKCPESMLKVARDNVYLMPTLGAMIAKIRDCQPIFNDVQQKRLHESKLMAEAARAFNAEFDIKPNCLIPKLKDWEYRPQSNPGSPYNMMAQETMEKPCTRISQCATEDWAIDDFREFLKLFSKSSNPPKLEKEKGHWTWQMSAGNCKITSRDDVAKGKPDRAIFQSPLFLRWVGGVLCQAYSEAVSHPGFLKHFSWAYGGAAKLLALVADRVDHLNGVRVEEDYDWHFEPLTEDLAGIMGLDDGFERMSIITTRKTDSDENFLCFSFPDVKSWDLTAPPVYYDQCEDRVQKFLDECSGADNLRALWKRVSKWVTAKTRLGRVLTNSRVVFNLKDRVMSGGARTYQQNTEGNLTGRIALQMAAWKEIHPHSEFEMFEADFACGDDLFAATLEKNRPLVLLANGSIKKVLGQQYKPETVGVYESVSRMPFLGRHVVCLTLNGQTAPVAMRPWRSILASVLFPKHNPPKGVSQYSYALVRVAAAWDEGALFYPQLRKYLAHLWEALKASGAQWPASPDIVGSLLDGDKYFVDDEGNPIFPSPKLRTTAELWHLHTGLSLDSSEEEDEHRPTSDDEDLGDDIDILGENDDESGTGSDSEEESTSRPTRRSTGTSAKAIPEEDLSVDPDAF